MSGFIATVKTTTVKTTTDPLLLFFSSEEEAEEFCFINFEDGEYWIEKWKEIYYSC